MIPAFRHDATTSPLPCEKKIPIPKQQQQQPFAKIPFLADMRASKRETTKAPACEENSSPARATNPREESELGGPGRGDRLKAFRTHSPRPPQALASLRDLGKVVRTDQMANHDTWKAFFHVCSQATCNRTTCTRCSFSPPPRLRGTTKGTFLAPLIGGKASNGIVFFF